IEKVLNSITLAVSFIGGFVFLSGALILIGSIAMTKFQRIYEIAVMKTLGAKRKVLVLIMLAEYGLLGLVSGTVGSVAGVLLSYAVGKRILEIPFQMQPVIGVIGIAGTVALVMAVGAASSFDALTHKPLSILRAE
ncbi:MAG TPA: FtsX-like permease family protein, partial [Blastocatellia bacterium]|nr:FtsX-like permease family protein [Blastocatellia bacterium]